MYNAYRTKPTQYSYGFGYGDDIGQYFEELKRIVKTDTNRDFDLYPENLPFINSLVHQIPQDLNVDELVNVSHLLGSFLGKVICKYAGVGYWRCIIFREDAAPDFYYLQIGDYVANPVYEAYRAIKYKDPNLFWQYFFHIMYEINQVKNGRTVVHRGEYPGYQSSLLTEVHGAVGEYMYGIYDSPSSKPDWEDELLSGLTIATYNSSLYGKPIEEKECILEKTDHMYGTEGTSVTIRQAPSILDDQRKILFSQALCGYLGRIYSDTEYRAQLRSFFQDPEIIYPQFNPDHIRSYLVNLFLSSVIEIDAYLTVVNSNIENEDGTPLFQVKKEDDGNMYLSMRKNEFSKAWRKLPESITAEIHEKIVELNPKWENDWRDYLLSEYDLYTKERPIIQYLQK